MSTTVVGIMHPGEMGASVAAAALSTGCTVLWCETGRSQRSRERAQEVGLQAVESLDQLVERSQTLVCVCPPHAATSMAEAVATREFKGLFVDANAIAPHTAQAVAASVTSTGAHYVDGGIIGPPAWKSGTTRLYLSGERAAQAGALFQGSLLEPVLLEGDAFCASALKMSYAAWTKGSIALLANVRALARASGVDDALCREWGLSQPGLETRSRDSVTASAFKAWRWIAEMHEIATSFDGAGLPGDFHRGAAEIYARMSGFKDQPPPALDDVLRVLRDGGSRRD